MIRTLTHLHGRKGLAQGNGGDGRRQWSLADLTGNAGGLTEAAKMSRGCTLGSGRPRGSPWLVVGCCRGYVEILRAVGGRREGARPMLGDRDGSRTGCMLRRVRWWIGVVLLRGNAMVPAAR